MEDLRRIEMNPKELDALVGRVKSGSMRDGDDRMVEAMAETIKVLHGAVEKKSSSIKRLLQLLFGPSTEKSRRVLKNRKKPAGGDGTPANPSKDKSKPKRKGHGRRGAAEYTGAKRIPVAHQTLAPGEPCPECPNGKVYRLTQSSPVLCIRGCAPLQAVLYDFEKLRCNLCGKVFTAAAPRGCGASKYDETVGSMIAVLKYGSGFPFNRLEKLQQGFGIPVPASTQWRIIDHKAETIQSAYEELLRQGARGTVIHNDDTGARILEFMSGAYEPPDPSRTGMFTSGIFSRVGQHTVALYYTGTQHKAPHRARCESRAVDAMEPPGEPRSHRIACRSR